MLFAVTLACTVALASPAQGAPVTVRRFLNVTNGTHFWSAGGEECANVLAQYSGTYSYEGPAWTLESSLVSDPLFRAYNVQTGAHFYTASFTEYASLSYPYVREGVAYYVSATPKSGYATVWRAYNTLTGTHFYTSGLAEYLALPWYYSRDGAAFWFPPANQVVNRLHRWANNSSTWPLCRINVNYSQLPADWRDAAYRSRMQWNNVGASNMYFYYNSTSGNTITRSYQVAMWLGMTVTTPPTPPDTILSARTELNGLYPWSASGTPSSLEYDVESVITHELGHWVKEADPHLFEEYGIGPDQSWPWATMYGFGGTGETHFRTLATEDIDGIRSLYGRKP